MGRKSNRKKWKLQELVVGLLEKALVPGAKVQVDQRLPNLKTGHLMQCDVLIRSGEDPRETTTIVEVQKRSRKVEYNDYRGWCQKRDDVGAQHLLCVSEKGFPQSVIDDAVLQGSSVRLLTLAELEGKNWPLQIVGQALILVEIGHEIKSFAIDTDVKFSTLETMKDTPLLRRHGKDQLMTPNDLAMELSSARKDLQFLRNGEYTFDIIHKPDPASPVDLVWEGNSTRVKQVKVRLRIRVTRHKLPLTCSEYVQENYKGTLAYAMTGSGLINGHRVDARLIFVPESNGLLRAASHAIEGLPAGSVVGVGYISAKKTP